MIGGVLAQNNFLEFGLPLLPTKLALEYICTRQIVFHNFN